MREPVINGLAFLLPVLQAFFPSCDSGGRESPNYRANRAAEAPRNDGIALKCPSLLARQF